MTFSLELFVSVALASATVGAWSLHSLIAVPALRVPAVIVFLLFVASVWALLSIDEWMQPQLQVTENVYISAFTAIGAFWFAGAVTGCIYGFS